ncbi:MAG: oligosaccharide flippase family protein [Chitinispirillaceae bacterium]|nr:oligosaccharide flippase family protein [Chitinispirillaceae bacterium]
MLGKAKNLFSQSGIRGRFVRGAGLLSVVSGVENGIGMLRTMLLARLLAPAEFGTMAAVLAITVCLRAFIQVGVQQCIIQSRQGREYEFLNVAWWFRAALSCAIFAPTFLAAPLLAGLFSNSGITSLLRVALITIVLDSIVSPRIFILEKEMRFGRWAVIMQGAAFINVVTSIIFALVLKNVWALVLGLLFESVSRFLLSFILCPFLPRLRIHHRHLAEIRAFAGGAFGLPVLLMLYQQVDVFFLGRMVSMSELGAYSLALTLARIPYMIYTATVSKLVLPLLSSLRDDREKSVRAFSGLTAVLSSAGIPLIIFFILFAKPVLHLAYGAPYVRSWVPFMFLATCFFLRIFNETAVGVFIAQGRPAVYRNYSVIRLVAAASLLFPFITVWKTAGAAAAVLVSAAVFWLLVIMKLRTSFSISLWQYTSLFIHGGLWGLLVVPTSAVMFFDGIFSVPMVQVFIGGACSLCASGFALRKTLRGHEDLFEKPAAAKNRYNSANHPEPEGLA